MPPRIQIISILICIFLLAYVFELVRRRYLNEEYSVTWLITGLMMLVLSIWDELLQGISELVGATLYTSTLFFFGMLFLVVICLHFSIRISALTNQVRTLTQDIGILYKERETLQERVSDVEKKSEPSPMEKL